MNFRSLIWMTGALVLVSCAARGPGPKTEPELDFFDTDRSRPLSP